MGRLDMEDLWLGWGGIISSGSGYRAPVSGARLQPRPCATEEEWRLQAGWMKETRPVILVGSTRQGLELETFHWCLRLLENVLRLSLIHLRGDAGVFLLHPKVVLNQVKRLLVNFLVFVTLQELDLVQA